MTRQVDKNQTAIPPIVANVKLVPVPGSRNKPTFLDSDPSILEVLRNQISQKPVSNLGPSGLLNQAIKRLHAMDELWFGKTLQTRDMIGMKM